MAKIPLRTYHHEIEGLIESGQIEQAIANCRHILKFFPKTVDTYRLLGKAFLESQRYSEAADVLQRVLTSMPEDFIAHLGMSIIREDEGNLDESIWHMERAFEVQPANAAVQGELRRLYGRRDGLEPPKVRLTRGALARMYLKGGLHQQAIAELRAALGEDPQRLDLLTLLAQAYHQSGQKVEAADACSNLLGRLPYSLEGNRLLAEILAGSERAVETESYRQRLQALDPYAAQLSAATASPENVPPESVTLEKLDWRPGQPSGEKPSQPAWAASLGVKVDSLETNQEALPDWLATPSSGAQAFPNPPGVTLDANAETAASFSNEPEPPAAEGEASGEAPIEAEIPAWMQEAGWGPSSGQAEDDTPALSFDKEAPSEELSPAELPEWLRSIAPPEAASGETGEPLPPESPAPQAGAPADDFLPWLAETPPGATDSVVSWLEAQDVEQPAPLDAAALESTPEETLAPEWLQELDAAPQTSDVAAQTGDKTDLPDWLQETPQESTPGEMPDWLKDLVETPEAEHPALDETLATTEQAPSETVWQPEPQGEQHPGQEPQPFAGGAQVFDRGTAGQETPAWLSELEAAPLPVEGEPAAEPAPDGENEAAAFAWLEGLAARQGAGDLQAEAAEEPPAQPEWLQEFGLAGDESRGAVSAVPAAGTLPEPDLGSANVAEPELPDWLQPGGEEPLEPAPEQTVEPSEEPALAAADLPDWLQELAPEGTAESAAEGAPEGAAGVQEEAFPWDLEADQPPAQAADLPDWLKDVAVSAGGSDVGGLAGLEEPPISEEDTKPTRLAQASEVSIPPELAVYVSATGAIAAGLLDTPEGKVGEFPSAGELEAGGAAASPAAAEETGREDLHGLGMEISSLEASPFEVIGEGPAEETSAVEDLTAGESPNEPQTGVELPQPEPVEAADLPEWLRSLDEEPETEWDPMRWSSEAEAAEMEQPAGAAEDLDTDEAFAWLEGLAARQGADEGLLVGADERQAEPPDWVTTDAEAGREAETPQAEAQQLPEGQPWETAEVTEALQPADEERLDSEPAPAAEFTGEAEAAILQPEAQQPPQAESGVTGEVTFSPELEALQAEAQQPPEAEPAPAAEFAGEADVEIFQPEAPEPFAPLADLEAEALEEPAAAAIQPEAQLPAEWQPWETAESTEAIEPEALQPEAETVPDLPAWLAEFEETPVEDTQDWTPPAQVEPVEQVEPSGEAGRLDLNRAALIDLERIPGIGFIRAQALLAYRESHGPLASLANLQNVPGFDAETLALIQDRVMVAAPLAEPVEPEAPPDPQQMALIQARNALAQGDRNAALDHYTVLLKVRALLPELIQDLHEAVYRFPDDALIWEALGDAFARNDQLQEALDAYTKAEELLG